LNVRIGRNGSYGLLRGNRAEPMYRLKCLLTSLREMQLLVSKLTLKSILKTTGLKETFSDL